MLDVRQIRYFLAVVEELHFTRAADRLHVAQSALSTQIRQLEETLGARLFERKKRALVELTDAGRLFAVEATRTMEQVERAEMVGKRAGRGELGHIEIGYVASAAFSGLLPNVIAEFRSSFPDVSSRLSEMETPRQIEAITEGRIDVGFCRPRHRYPEGINADVIFQEQLVLAVPSRLAGPLDMGRLELETFIVPAFDESGFMEYVTDFVREMNLQPIGTLVVRDFLTALSLVASGSGIALVPESLRCVSMQNVVYCSVDQYERTVGLAIAYRTGRIEPAVKAFVDAARRRFPLRL